MNAIGQKNKKEEIKAKKEAVAKVKKENKEADAKVKKEKKEEITAKKEEEAKTNKEIKAKKETKTDIKIKPNNTNIMMTTFIKQDFRRNVLENTQNEDKILFNNEYVLSKIEINKHTKNARIIQEMKQIEPLLSDDILLQLYTKSISIHQGNVQCNGAFLENDILGVFLNEQNISNRKQVTINKEGIIVGFNERKDKCYHIVDFVIGDDIKIGESIKKYKVISCKTTCRERWTQDDWTYTFAPQKYILLTISNDYPTSLRFREGSNRKIITCTPKKKDDRIYKLNFENLIHEL